MIVEILYPSQCILGESPLWHAERKCCFWVDIENGVLYEYNWMSQTARSWKFDYRLTLVVQAEGDQLILALNAKIARFNLETEQLEWLLDVEVPTSGNRCNDGACDSSGRLWVGTMHLEHRHGQGALYCIDNNLVVQKKISNTTISNGIAWSLDNKRLYYIDSQTRLSSLLFSTKNQVKLFLKRT